MIKLSNKIISIFVGVVLVGTITATAAVVTNHNNLISQTTSQINSSNSTSFVSSQSDSSVSSFINSANQSSSSITSSSKAMPQKGVNNTTTETINQNKQTANKETSKSSNSTKIMTSQTQNNQSEQPMTKEQKLKRYQDEINSEKWPVIDPDSGVAVYPNDPNYDKIKAELGGDAGTVNPDKSTACQKAVEEARQKYYEKQKAESEGKPSSSQNSTGK